MLKFLNLSFLPKSDDVALFLLRLGFGAYMLIVHGWGKLTGWSKLSTGFPDPLGVSSTVSLGLTVFAEVLAAALLIVGLFTRLSAFILAFTMGVAFFIVHGGTLSGEGSGEMAALYGVAYFGLIFTGAGRYSIDAKLKID